MAAARVKATSEMLGARQLQAVLKALPDRLARNALNAAVRAGAKVIQKEAYIQLAMVMRSRPPRPKDVLIIKERGRKDIVLSEYLIGPPTFRPELRWLHSGTIPHPIDIFESWQGSQALGPIEGRGILFADTIVHPGQRATLWMLKAYFRGKDRALKAMAEKLVKSIPVQVKRLVSEKYSAQLRARIRKARKGRF